MDTGHTPGTNLSGALLMERLLRVAETARDFVATTSYYRQPKASRPEFEALAIALIALSGEVER